MMLLPQEDPCENILRAIDPQTHDMITGHVNLIKLETYPGQHSRYSNSCTVAGAIHD